MSFSEIFPLVQLIGISQPFGMDAWVGWPLSTVEFLTLLGGVGSILCGLHAKAKNSQFFFLLGVSFFVFGVYAYLTLLCAGAVYVLLFSGRTSSPS